MRKLIVSFSGGRTSAYMSKMLIDNYSDRFDLKFVFMNTGMEHEETLNFVDRCDKEFGLNLVWLEAVTHHGDRKGCTHKIVSFDTASRNGEPFEGSVSKYGIPNQNYPWCTRELKINPFKSFLKEMGWSKEFRAIGIRTDEMKRLPKSASIERKLYPLIDFFPTTKDDVLDFWDDQDFDLEIEDYLGNCVTCWKKSSKKLCRIYNESPCSFDLFRKIESEHAKTNSTDGEDRVFFRQRMTVDGIASLAALSGSAGGYMCDEGECGVY